MTCSNQSPQPLWPFHLSNEEAAELLPGSKYDWYLYTDGSGDTSLAGGYAAIAFNDKLCRRIVSVGCSTHTTVGRAEFTAILNGLHSILTETKEYSKLQNLEVKKPTVLVITDRQDLAGCICGAFAKKSNGDLWARYSWYLNYFNITAVHIDRETNSMQSIADKAASNMYQVLKEFYQIQTESNNI